MGRKVLFLKFPELILLATDTGIHRYVKSDSMYAVFGEVRGDEKVLFTLKQPRTYVCEGIADGGSTTAQESVIAPVYQVNGQGPPAIPTGDILVRMASGHNIAEIENDLKEIGYTLKNALSYAPHAGWVQAQSGSLEAALGGLQALAKVPGVEHVEPQMLSQLAKKSSPNSSRHEP